MKIVINKLFGKFNAEIEIDKKLNILVGENGIGKSNILRICNLILNNNYAELTKYYFDNIKIYDTTYNEPIVINHCALFPTPNEICEKIKLTEQNLEESDKLIYLIKQLDCNNLLNEFIVYCYYDSNLSIRLDRFLEKYSYNKDYQIKVIQDILSNIYTENSKDVKSFVSIDKIIKEDKKCYYLNFVENYKIENKLHEEGNILKGILDAYEYMCNGNYTFVYKGEDDDELFNIYKMDEFNNEVYKNMQKVKTYNFKNYKIKSLNINNIINKLINEKNIDINKLISNLYYDEEFIKNIYSKINSLDEKYKDYFMMENKHNLAQNANAYKPSEEEIQKIKKFYNEEHNKDKIKNYILPLMPKDSPYEFFITRAFSNNFVNENNYMFFRLYEIYNCIIEDIENYKNPRIVELEELFKKYIKSKEVIIKPTGIHIFDKEMDTKEQILKTNHEKNIELDYLSAGEKKIIILLILGMFVEDSIFIIDEIENSLSIIWQEEIINDLVNISKQNNLIIATQSAYALKNKKIQKNILFLPFEEV